LALDDRPVGGYDTGTQAGDLVALMDALGHQRFAVVGHDTGFAISYAKSLPDDVIDYYVGMLSNPDSLRGSFGWYRALESPDELLAALTAFLAPYRDGSAANDPRPRAAA
jgi:pimeloyl-ACP methyl ester carboxylesterase